MITCFSSSKHAHVGYR